MEFRTQVAIQEPPFRIEPCEEILFVGSCFADAIGQRFREEAFPVTVNPYGVMYNPASILHTVEKWKVEREKWKEHTPNMAFLTLGTNHVYRLKETGEIVDNCEKRPAALFQEEQLSVDQCADYLRQSIDLLHSVNPDIHVVLTVSPIRYRKYGYHESQLSKATLLLAIEQLVATTPAGSLTDGQSVALRIPAGSVTYFPAYELILDELRDYRFYAADMLHRLWNISGSDWSIAISRQLPRTISPNGVRSNRHWHTNPSTLTLLSIGLSMNRHYQNSQSLKRNILI